MKTIQAMSILSKLFTQPSKEDILRFNYELNFSIIPALTNRYNNNKNLNVGQLLDFDQFENPTKVVTKLSKQIKAIETGIKGHSGISLILVEMPSNGNLSEVEIGMIAVNKKLHHSIYFTMEYSFGGYMMCVIDEQGHGSIKEVSNRESFCFEVFKTAMSYWENMETAQNPIAEF